MGRRLSGETRGPVPHSGQAPVRPLTDAFAAGKLVTRAGAEQRPRRGLGGGTEERGRGSGPSGHRRSAVIERSQPKTRAELASIAGVGEESVASPVAPRSCRAVSQPVAQCRCVSLRTATRKHR